VLEVVDQIAKELLKKWPDLNIEDEHAVTQACLMLDIDLRPNSGGQFAYADVLRAARCHRTPRKGPAQ